MLRELCRGQLKLLGSLAKNICDAEGSQISLSTAQQVSTTLFGQDTRDSLLVSISPTLPLRTPQIASTGLCRLGWSEVPTEFPPTAQE